jgi:hypothetical protein
MSNHGSFVGISTLALVLAVKMARLSLILAERRDIANHTFGGRGAYSDTHKPLQYPPAIATRTRTRTNTNPYDTKAIAVGRS